MKRTKVVLLTAVLCAFAVFLSGCKLFSANDELLIPPRPQGELYEIQNALDGISANRITLKYPTAGEYRSAIIDYDITGNGVNDAVAFYSTETEELSAMHIAVVSKKDGKWVAAKDVSVLASGVERVEFDDLDGDGRNEIIVGWSIYGSVDKEVAVYSFDGETLTPYAQEKYTEFIRCDLDTDQNKELLVLHINSADNTATARLLRLESTGLVEVSSCGCDGGVSGYSSVIQTKLLNGKPAVFADAKKGTSAVTEILYIENGQLVNPMYDRQAGKNLLTERQSSVSSQDINGDGTADIPMQQVLAGYENAASGDRVYMTKWCSFDGEKLVITMTALMNYADGYYLTVPKELEDRITVDKNVEARMRTIYLYDSETGARTAELFKLRVISLNNWETSQKDKENWQQLATGNSVVYAASVGNYAGEYAFSVDDIKSLFNLIK